MFKKILMPIDFQETQLAERTVETAVGEARKHGAELYVLTVIPGFGMPLVATFFPENAMKKAVEEVSKELKKFVSNAIPDDVSVHPIIAQGNPAEEILKQANKLSVDLIVMASHVQSSTDILHIGSNASRVVEQSKCSVMVVKT